MNLVGPSALSAVWTRHVADSLQLLSLAPDARVWVDLGSGAGFPGLVIACALADRSDAVAHLVESNRKKAGFLREAARVSGAAASVHHCRAEQFVEEWQGEIDIVTARALAPLPKLLLLAEPLLRKGAQALFLKGQDVEAELTESAKYWIMDVTSVISRSDPDGRVVHIRSARKSA
jgi:16S rRNA (guanine527-N7)-methyltransferase